MNHISQNSIRVLIACVVAISALPSIAAPPNVILIFADDLGYGDLGCYGATKVQTPNIDRLAKEGRRFTDAHSVSAVCTPSRYALLTGVYPLRANGGKGIWGPAPITSPLLINPDKRTIADVFKKSGYDTAVMGKWHLGFKTGKNDWRQPLRPGPQDLGFDYYFGMPVVNSAPPYVYVENDRVVGGDPNDPLVHVGRSGKGTTPITPIPPEAAQRSANQFKGATQAHKLYNDYEVGTTFAKKAVEWIEGREGRPFFLYLATTNIHHPFTPAKRFQGTSQCGLYGDYIHELDWMVGEILACLEDKGLSDNTLVIFTSDNGGMFNLGGQNAFKAGHRQNGDLLGFKFGVWEGGHRIPFIARWPGKIKAGTTSDQLLGNVDMLATFAAVTGEQLDKSQQRDSVNMLPAIVGDPEKPIRDHLILTPHKGSHLSVRKGKWMYIPRQGSGGFSGRKPGQHTFAGPAAASFVGSVNSDIENGTIRKDAPPGQLYDLEADVNQTKNLYREHPEVVEDLNAVLAGYRGPARRPAAGNSKSAPRRPAKKTPATPSNRSASFDFESGKLEPWKVVEGEFGHVVGSREHFFRSNDEYNKQGKYYLTTLEANADAEKGSDPQTGVIVSPLFVASGGPLSFRVGGGNGPDTYIALCTADGKELHRARGINSQQMQEAGWDLTPYAGKKLFLKVVDRSTDGWGHLTVDDFQFDGKVLDQLPDMKPRAEKELRKASSASTDGQTARPPNIVLIFADDLGYGDLGCYGATKLKTPNIDRLATEGRRFTDAHSASAVCTPSRYGLLTGEYPMRAHGGKGAWGPLSPSSGLIIDTNTLTLGKAMQRKGYATACVGKWHLGFKKKTNDWQVPLRPGPQDVGFDYYWGIPQVNSGPPYVYVENDTIVGHDANDPLAYKSKKSTKAVSPTPTFPIDAGRKSPNRFTGALKAHQIYDDEKTGTLLTEKAVKWIGENKDEPFFLYFPTPNIHHPFTPAPRFKGTSACGYYGDFVHELDWMVGELLKCLDEHGLTENTLVIFTSDNGGMLNHTGRLAMKAGHRINGDLLGFKFGAWEGGHRVPLIAKWPGKIKPGTESDQLISQVDMLASFMALTGQDTDNLAGKDSVNVLPALLGETDEALRSELVISPKKASHLTIRTGKWVYIGAKGSGGFSGGKPTDHAWGGVPAITFAGSVNSDIENGRYKKDAPSAQLYDLEKDPSQTKNVYREHPEIVKRMQARLKALRSKPGKTVPVSVPGNTKPRAGKAKPNFVVIFADDLGYGDLSCYGPTGVKTPHLDKLAKEGFRSTDFFVPANVCSPSRAALLTGRYPMRCGLPVARNESVRKYDNYGLHPDELTIPELLKPAGYRSLMVGKWHLGISVEGSNPIDAGFDEHLGIPSNYGKNRGANYNTLYRGKEVEQRNVPCEQLTKRYTDEAVAFIERQKDEPFFIYVSHHIVHSPLLPRKEFVGKSGKGKYGDFVQELDHSTGRIMKALRDAGVDDNTLVVFTSDNGPTRPGSAGGLNAGKYCTMEGGHRVPGIFRFPGVIPPGQVSDVTLTSMDLLPVLCELAGVDLPTDRKIDGKNILPILEGDVTKTPHEMLYYYNGTNLQAVREGDWKLHLPRTVNDQPFWSKSPKQKHKGFVTLDEPRLFNLKTDLGEKRDVADKHPDVMARLQKRAEAIRAELGDVRVTGSDQRKINLVDPQER